MNKIEIPIHPKPAIRINHKGRHKPNAIAYYKYKDSILSYCKAKGFELGNEISITFYIPIGKSIAKKERAKRLGQPHTFKPDLDNLIKAVKDALLKDDCAVWRYKDMQKIWSEEGKIVIENVV